MNFRSPARLGLACAFSLAALAAGSAQAQEGLAMKSVLGKMGIIPEEKDPIRYRERAPLVLPPKGTDLREPLAPADYASNPQWPNDPDVVERRRRDAESRRPATESELYRMSERNPRLSPEEMRTGRTASANAGGARAPGYARGDDARDQLYLSPDQLRAGRKTGEDEDGAAPAEPRRRTLAEPPSGMRRSASGKRIESVAADPRVDQQALDANPLTWIKKQFRSSDEDE